MPIDSVPYESLNLATLPLELRSRICEFLFAASSVQLASTATTEVENSLLSLQLVSKTFYTDNNLYHRFLRNATVNVYASQCLCRYEEELSTQDRSLLRHVCINPAWITAGVRCGTKRLQAIGALRKLSIKALINVFPNLQTVTIRQRGAHINTFHCDYDYSLEKLVVALQGPSDAASAEKVSSQVTESASEDYRSASPDTSLSYSANADIIINFSQTLYKCFHRTAANYNPRWYYQFIHDAATSDVGVVITFNLELMFPSASDPTEYVTIENATIDTGDWTLRFTALGKRLEALQMPSEDCWEIWLKQLIEILTF